MMLATLTEKYAENIDAFFESKKAHGIILFLVLINAMVFALDTIPSVKHTYGTVLFILDKLILGIFIIELLARAVVSRALFFKKGWNIFDLFVTIASLIPSHYGFGALRIFRLLHCFRMLELLPKAKHILDGFAHSLISIVNIFLFGVIFFFVSGLIATEFFKHYDQENFGTIGMSMLSLFRLIFSGDVKDLKNIYDVYPQAWIFIVSFCIIVGYFVVNLVIGAIVNAMAKAEDENEGLDQETPYEKTIMLMSKEIQLLRQEMGDLKRLLATKEKP